MGKTKRILIILAAVTAVGIGAGLLYYELFLKLEMVSQSITVELGEEVSSDIGDYLKGSPILLGDAVLDTSEVDCSTVGSYTAYVYVNNTTYTYTVKIVDTTGPSLTLVSNDSCLATDCNYSCADYVDTCSDLSGTVYLSLYYRDREYDFLSFSEVGVYEVTVRAEDAYGNVTEKSVSMHYEDAPHIILPDTYEMKVGELFHLNDYLLAWDYKDGIYDNLDVTIDTGDFTILTLGSYTITVSVTDSDGLTSTEELTVEVGDSSRVTMKLSEEDLTYLCDRDYFETEPLTTASTDAAKALVRPSQVHLYYEDDSKQVNASGVIYQIDSDYLYLISVDHAVSEMNNATAVTFCDGAIVKESYSYIQLSDENEIVMFRIPTGDLDGTTLLQLREAYVADNPYSDLTLGDTVFTYAAFLQDRSDYIADASLTSLDYEGAGFSFSKDAIATTKNTISGMSGGGTFDSYGRLIGIADGHKTGSDISYHLKVDQLSDLYVLASQ